MILKYNKNTGKEGSREKGIRWALWLYGFMALWLYGDASNLFLLY